MHGSPKPSGVSSAKRPPNGGGSSSRCEPTNSTRLTRWQRSRSIAGSPISVARTGKIRATRSFAASSTGCLPRCKGQTLRLSTKRFASEPQLNDPPIHLARLSSGDLPVVVDDHRWHVADAHRHGLIVIVLDVH